MGQTLSELRPDILFVIADRYEALAIALAGLCMNVRIAHLEGGEVSGSIDERIRHAITKLAHLHFAANTAAAERLRRMGEHGESIFVVGTPSLDLLAELNLHDRSKLAQSLGRDGQGLTVNVEGEYVVVSQHPVVTEHEDAPHQFAETASAVRQIGLPAVWLLPNDDGGAAAIGPVVESLARDPGAPPVCCVAALQMVDYAVLLKNARCLIGNSSSGLREGAFLGVPAVNIGTRQTGRQRGANVIDVAYDSRAISAAARRQMAHGPYPSDPVYGDGRAGEKIARVLAEAWMTLDKTIAY
jgi:UDP-hydrolysing UDP-N-acetyl-D-glucosamine 2-epimerase